MHWNTTNKQKKTGILHRRDGSTMVEVIVSFLILVIACTLFSNCIVFAANMQKRSAQLRQYASAFQEAIVSENTSGAADRSTASLHFSQTGGANSFDVSVQEETQGYTVKGETADVYRYSNTP